MFKEIGAVQQNFQGRELVEQGKSIGKQDLTDPITP